MAFKSPRIFLPWLYHKVYYVVVLRGNVPSISLVTSVQSGWSIAPLNNHNALLTEPVSQTRKPIPGYKWWVGFRWLSSAVRRHHEGINVTDDLKRTKYDHITLPALSPNEPYTVQTAKANFKQEHRSDLICEIWDTDGGDYEYVTPCNLVGVYLRFRGMYCLYLQGRRILPCLTFSWTWRRGWGRGVFLRNGELPDYIISLSRI
jgi:hypothetical protein